MSTEVSDNISEQEPSLNTLEEETTAKDSSSSVETSPTPLYFLTNGSKTASFSPLVSAGSTTTVENEITQPVKPSTSTHSQKHVHFPTDDVQLTKVSAAPVPLSNQPFVPLKTVLRIYLDTCLKSQIKPLQTIIDQLSRIKDERQTFYDRIERLSIINEKFGVSHLDAFEEIFSRVQFHTLEFESSLYEDTLIASLFDIIEYYESCIHLNLSGNRSMNSQSYQALGRYMRKSYILERLDMNHMKFDDNTILTFGRCLRFSSTLIELHLESCQLNGKILQNLIQHIRVCNGLRELYLGDNRLQVQDSLILCDVIRTCGHFLNLLDLKTNYLQDNGLSHIASQLSQYDEHHTQRNILRKLNLQSNQISQQGIGYLAKALLHNRTINSLNLSNNNLTNEGLFLLRDSLLANRCISELILRNCKLTCQAAISLAEYVAESSIIQHIDLRGNNIQASGIMALSLAMKHNKSLIKLELDSIVSTQENGNVVSSQSQTNNIDRTTNSLLSFTNLKRITSGIGHLSNVLNQNSDPIQDARVKQFLEQKSKWINDITEICRRNKERQCELEEQEEQKEEKRVNGEENQQNNEHQEETVNEEEAAKEETVTVLPEASIGNPALLNKKSSNKFVSPLPSPLLSLEDDLSPFLVKKIFKDDDQQSSPVSRVDHDQVIEHTPPTTSTNDIIESIPTPSSIDFNSEDATLSNISENNNPINEMTFTNNNSEPTIPAVKSPFTIDDYDDNVDEDKQEEKKSNNIPINISDIHFDSLQHEDYSIEQKNSERKDSEDDIDEYDEHKKKPFRHSDSLFLLRNKAGDLGEDTMEERDIEVDDNNSILPTNQPVVLGHEQQLIN
ncbi:unnamed protein product [Didymodactylos carnosus]|uniref:Uncharacterized protein n=1 Tax=Didymodactylos carnosus TaxID=1234261 RepID=A0A813WK77_9BILA|nr:unnamed protein product [Didymodactylos carnosus]CAF1298218.1 unnamed protein product [Didymodactylos carnosus]CAF3640039.1 unnamed protein product [Didymodactylos carnosus]CAF4103815.1 unnamed protein product [Didymodactylos carnosus]